MYDLRRTGVFGYGDPVGHQRVDCVLNGTQRVTGGLKERDGFQDCTTSSQLLTIWHQK